MARIAKWIVPLIAALAPPGDVAAAPPRGPAVAPVKGGSAKLVPRRKQSGLGRRSGPLTEVALERVSCTGGLDEAAVRPVLQGLRTELKRCLERHPAQRDRLQLELRVAASGRTQVVVHAAGAADKALASCARLVVAAAAFPARSLPTQVVLTLAFKPGAQETGGAAKGGAGLGAVLGVPAAREPVAAASAAGVQQLEIRAVGAGGLGAIARGLEKDPPLESSTVRAAIASQLATVRRCQSAGRSAVRVELRVGASGAVEAARVLSSTIADPQQRCVIAAARSWRFPRPRGGGAVIRFTLPLPLAR